MFKIDDMYGVLDKLRKFERDLSERYERLADTHRVGKASKALPMSEHVSHLHFAYRVPIRLAVERPSHAADSWIARLSEFVGDHMFVERIPCEVTLHGVLGDADPGGLMVTVRCRLYVIAEGGQHAPSYPDYIDIRLAEDGSEIDMTPTVAAAAAWLSRMRE